MRAFVAVCLLLGNACTRTVPPSVAPSTAPPPSAGAPWTATRDADHPLVGHVWSVAGRGWVTPDGLFDALATARFVTLGEKHDAPDHHRLQAAVLHGLALRGVRPAVAVEMIAVEQQAAVDGAAPEDPDAIGEAVGWATSGWPPFATYRPLFVEVRSHWLPLVGAGVTRAKVQSLLGKDAPPLAAEIRAKYHLDEALPDQAGLEAELLDSHCGALPKDAVARMAAAQRLRDGVMAETMASRDQAVLIAGAGHARRDRGVPWILAKMRPDAAVLSVAFVEVQTSYLSADAYGAMFHAKALPFDYVWFTPRLDDDDPCKPK